MEAPAAKPVLCVAAICGSIRKASWHRGLIRAAAEVCEESIPGLRVDDVDVADLPMLNTDLETDGGRGFPPAVEAFRAKVRDADCFLFASPEYNYSITSPLKNALDWASRGVNCWADKPAAIVCAGGNFGGGRSSYHLRQVGVFLDIHFLNKPELFVFAFDDPDRFFDADGNLIHAETRERLGQVLLSLQAFTLRLQNKD
ncbi:putative NADPH:quinone oxidoreductase 1 [Panicum miliaceum]|uniref:NAD(P)H dehydrogenase (quinone) n=1 Tax=Panicum miliaceum TaxID=4540 RepID=A0A3L6SCR4_PANMI|nr:putative NADPH:quinone oxidoreductase 1 [Panicum miliaceum]